MALDPASWETLGNLRVRVQTSVGGWMQSKGPMSFCPLPFPCDAADPQGCGPGPATVSRRLEAHHSHYSPMLVQGKSLGQGRPKQEASLALLFTRQMGNRRDHGGSCCS